VIVTPGSVVLVDMDGVLADWYGSMFDWLEEGGVDPEGLDETRWDLGATEMQRKAIRAIQATPGFYAGLNPIGGAVEGMYLLRDLGATVKLCSTPDATNPTCASDKVDWVANHLGTAWVKDLILTHDKTLVRGAILIDDKPEITGAVVPEWEHVLFDQPYNRHITGKRILAGWGALDTLKEKAA
jgi:5'-nucleotidase